MTLARTADYWFSPSAFFVQLNAAGDRNFIHANCSAGSAVMCYMKGVDGLGYDNGHNYKRWTLIASPTAFNDNKAKYVYIAIPKSDAADAVAQFVWPSEQLDIYGYNEEGELIGSEDYYYIWTQGIISASEVNGVRVDREWTQMYETGTLSTDEAFDAERDGLWWRWDPITDTVEFLKTISKAVFEELKADFATIGQLFVENDANIGGDLNVDGIIWALQGRINDLRSQNFSGSGLGDTGWWLTNDKDGHSYLEVDELLVRMKATFLELEIRKETFTGGNVHYSPAGSIIYRVDYMTADNLLLGYTEVRVPWLLKRMPFLLDKFAYSARRRIRREMTDEEWLRCAKFRCYMMADDGTTATRNWWQVGDQARCQSFNKTKVTAKRNGTYSTTYVNAEDPSEPWSTDFYWRMVIEVGSEILEDGHAYDYVDFAFADQKDAAGNYVNSEADRRAQCIAGSGIPAAGDTIVCMGNRFNPERMNMVSILSVGADAPAIKGYKGINTFSFEGCEVFCISPKKVEIRSNSFKWILDDGKVLPPKMFRGVYVPGTRYHYYDEVSWIGSIWLCIITDEYFWENAQGTRFSANDIRDIQEGEGNFAYTVANLPGMEDDEVFHGEDHYYKRGTNRGGQTVYYVRNYTYSEPADTNPSWLKEVSKGTEITEVITKYAASKDGINHPAEDSALWKDTIAETGIKPGQYLWTRTITYYSDDRTPTESYSCSRWGIDGDGISEINSYYWATNLVIQDMAAYERDNTVNWKDTFSELGNVGEMQGWYVWEKTVITYDLANDIDGNPRTMPDLISYKVNRIGQDGQIGQEEYYCLSEFATFDKAFPHDSGNGPSPAYIGIRWLDQDNPATQDYRLKNDGRLVICTEANKNSFPGYTAGRTPVWSSVMPTYDNSTPDKAKLKYLWNFEQRVDGMGTEYATRPICIGDHSRGIVGVLELYALSAYSEPQNVDRRIPNDIWEANNNSNTDYSKSASDKPKTWSDEKYDRAPTEELPYQWNWTRTLYNTPMTSADTARDPNTGWPFEDHYHVSAVRGTKGQDGAGVEYIYKRTQTDTPPTGYDGNKGQYSPSGVANGSYNLDPKLDDFVPQGWTDNPQGISHDYPYEWVCERCSQATPSADGFSGGHKWGAFKAPKIWSKWGYNGQDGDGTEYVFIRTKNDTPPVILSNDGGSSSEYKSQEWRPYVNGSGRTDIETNDGTTAKPRCTDDPKGTSRDWPYEWVAKRTMGAPSTATANKGHRDWKSYYECMADNSHKMSKWSNYGENSMRLDIDNEMDLVQTDSTGKVTADRTVQTVVRFYDGAKEIKLNTSDITASGATKTTEGNGVKLAWSYTAGSSFLGTEITISYTYAAVATTFKATFTIAASLGQPIFQLKPSLNSITFSRKRDNTLTPASRTLTLSIVKIDGGSSKELTVANSGQIVRYSTSSMPSSATSGTAWPTNGVAVSSDANIDNVYIAMFNSNGVLIDRETIPVLRDGRNGATPDAPVACYRWYKDGITPSAPTTKTQEPTPAEYANDTSKAYPSNKWSKNALNRQADGWNLWMSQSTRYTADDGTVTYDAWSTPVRISGDTGTPGEDGDEREWIYSYSNSGYNGSTGHVGGSANGSDTNKNQPDWIPNGWTDNPRGVSNSNKTEYASWRDITHNGTTVTYGAFHEPIIWSHYGERGIDGDGVEYVFIRTSSDTAPTVNSNSNDHNGKSYLDDEYLPWTDSGNNCVDDPVGPTKNLPYEWVAMRTKGSPNANGERAWNRYSGKMSLWAKYSKDGDPGDPGEPGVGYKKINASLRKYTLAQWHQYGDGGHTESWGISGYDNSHIRVGDSVYLMGKVSDAKDRAGNMVDVSAHGVCTEINASTIYMATTFIIVGGTAGERGATMRGPQQWNDLPSNYQFYSGGAGEPYVDVVIYNGNYYVCTTTHKKSSSWQSSYWSGTQQVDIVATKLLLANYAYLKNLGAGAIVMYDNSGSTSEDHIVFMAKDGVISCKVGTFENVTVSGTLKGVTGTFNWLDCVDSNGNKVGRICASTSAYGGVAFESVDVVHQGNKDGRSLRFLSSDIWCRGNFGAESRNTAVVTGSTIKYYTKGVSNSPVIRSLQSYTSSAGKTYYKVPCYGGSYGDASGFPVDLLIFSINSSTTYYYVLEMTPTKRMMVFNANDNQNNVVIFYNGREFTVDGGESGEVFQMPPDFMIPVPASNVLGRGLIVSGTRDIDWG